MEYIAYIPIVVAIISSFGAKERNVVGVSIFIIANAVLAVAIKHVV
jgi:hypothetical protein